MNRMNCDLSDVLFDEFKIQNRIRELGMLIASDYKDSTPVLIGILKGGFIFLSDLVRSIRIPLEIDCDRGGRHCGFRIEPAIYPRLSAAT